MGSLWWKSDDGQTHPVRVTETRLGAATGEVHYFDDNGNVYTVNGTQYASGETVTGVSWGKLYGG